MPIEVGQLGPACPANSVAIYLSNTAFYQDIGGGTFFHFATSATVLVAIDNGMGAAVMVIDKALGAVAPTLSVTRALSVNGPAVVGVPLKTPAEDKVSPGTPEPDHV